MRYQYRVAGFKPRIRMSATLSFTSMRPVPPENTRTEPLMSGEREMSTQPLASADTANDTPIDVSAAFCRTGADTISLPGLLSSTAGFSGAFASAPGWVSAAAAADAATAANPPINPRLLIVMFIFCFLTFSIHGTSRFNILRTEGTGRIPLFCLLGHFGVQLEQMGDDFGFGRVGHEAVGGKYGAVVGLVRSAKVGRHREWVVEVGKR